MKNNKSRKKKMKAGARAAVIGGSIVGFILVAAVAVVCVLIHYINKMNYVPLDENYTIASETMPHIEDVTNPMVVEETSRDSSQEELNEYQSLAEAALENVKGEYSELGEIYNILLIGSDTREQYDTGRSDTMMLISINREQKRIVATSFLRDLYVKLPQRGYDKINAAYAWGGVEMLLDTLEYNFSLHIDKYISVDFFSFVKVVDILGGIDVDVQEDELFWCNQYIHASNLLLGEPEHSDYLEGADGTPRHLSGKQALAYSRFRYVGNGDFTRTERQRKVINIIFDKMKKINAKTLIELLDSILPMVTTNIPTGEFLELIAILPEISRYDIISWSIPDDSYKYLTIDGVSSIGIDFNHYIDKIYKYMYADIDELQTTAQ
ncbi:MAG: LCP family protein [Butyrivibrio sp.]|nr:LCP family protein [Butyrivibrio sp.]